MADILMLLADGFEDVEALGTRDLLIRGGQRVVTASISDSDTVRSSFGVWVKADKTLKDTDFSKFDLLILPGGGLGVRNLGASNLVKLVIEYFIRENKVIAAICAAPSILGKYGFLKDKKFTCYAGFNEGFAGIFTAEECVTDGKIITARSMQYFDKFAYAILDAVGYEKQIEVVKKQIEGLTNK